MNKEEFAQQLNKQDGLDRQGRIRTIADDSGKIFLFSENKYGCPVIDVLTAEGNKHTMYVMTESMRTQVTERTGNYYQVTDPRDENCGSYVEDLRLVERDINDALCLKFFIGSKEHSKVRVRLPTETLRKSAIEKYGLKLVGGFVPPRFGDDGMSYSSPEKIMKKAIDVYDRENFREAVERKHRAEEARRQREAEEQKLREQQRQQEEKARHERVKQFEQQKEKVVKREEGYSESLLAMVELYTQAEGAEKKAYLSGLYDVRKTGTNEEKREMAKLFKTIVQSDEKYKQDKNLKALSRVDYGIIRPTNHVSRQIR